MSVNTATLYALLKTDGLQKATGSAFFLMFIFVFIFFLLTKVLEFDDRSMEPRIKSMLNLTYMSMGVLVLNYIHTTVAGTLFSFFLTISIVVTLAMLFLSLNNSVHLKKYDFGKLVTKGILFLTYLSTFIIFNLPK